LSALFILASPFFFDGLGARRQVTPLDGGQLQLVPFLGLDRLPLLVAQSFLERIDLGLVLSLEGRTAIVFLVEAARQIVDAFSGQNPLALQRVEARFQVTDLVERLVSQALGM